jgi:hypothetical protein
MAVLADEDRRRVWAHVMRRSGNIAVTKADLRAAVDATDAWLDANQTSYNAALPLPFRTSANIVQKTVLLCFVAMRRAGLLGTEEDG